MGERVEDGIGEGQNHEALGYSECSIVMKGEDESQSKGELKIQTTVMCQGKTVHNEELPVSQIKPVPIPSTPITLFQYMPEDEYYALVFISGHKGPDPFELQDSSFTKLPTLSGSEMADMEPRAPLLIDSSNVTLRNVKFEGNQGFLSGGAYVQMLEDPDAQGVSVKFIKCTFHGNKGEMSGGIYLDNFPTFYMSDSTFMASDPVAISSNSELPLDLRIEGTDFKGARERVPRIAKSSAIEGTGPGSISLYKCTFEQHENKDGGAIVWKNSLAEQALLDVSDCEFKENKADIAGGACALNGALRGVFTRTTFEENTAKYEGGAILVSGNADDKAVLDLIDVKFLSNESPGGKGGACSINTGMVNVTGGESVNNRALEGGGALSLRTSGSVSIVGTKYTKNSLAREASGGAINIEGSKEVVLTDVTFRDNAAANLPCSSTSDKIGGGALFYAGTTESKLVITGGKFYDHTATGGGVLYLLDIDDVQIKDSTLDGGQAYHGGGIFMKNIARAVIEKSSLLHLKTCRWEGGAVRALSDKDGTIAVVESHFNDNSAPTDDGGALVLKKFKSITITSSHFTGNKAGKNGGAIYTKYPSNVLLNNTDFKENEAVTGGSIVIKGSSKVAVEVSACDFIKNKARDSSGGISMTAYESDSSLHVTGSEFEDNDLAKDSTAGGPGALAAYGVTSVTIENTELRKNYGHNGGSAAFNSCTTVQLLDVELLDNAARKMGGALYLSSVDSLDMKRATFDLGKAEGDGGHLFMEDVKNATLSESIKILDGRARYSGGAVVAKNVIRLSLDDVVVKSNEAILGSGGGLYTVGVDEFSVADVELKDNTAKQHGGGWFAANSGKLINITMSHIENNRCQNGGGIWIGTLLPVEASQVLLATGNAAETVVAVNGTDFVDNTATQDGGAFLVKDVKNVMITSTHMKENEAKQGGGLFLEYVGSLEMSNVTIEREKAKFEGGALIMDSVGSVTADDLSLLDNKATEMGGGLVCGNDTNIAISNSTFKNNRAKVAPSLLAECGCTMTLSHSKFLSAANGQDGAVQGDPTCSDVNFFNCTFENHPRPAGVSVLYWIVLALMGLMLLGMGVILYALVPAVDDKLHTRNVRKGSVRAPLIPSGTV